MRLVYVTSRYPFGPGEAFLGPELAAHVAAGWDVSVFPAFPKGAVVHEDAAAILERVTAPGAGRAVSSLATALVTRKAVRQAVSRMLRRPQRGRVRAKNVAVLSRVGALASHLQRVGAEHVHVHWGGTSSTLAMAAAEAVSLPWSLTLHRWDIYENNLLAEKVRNASFTRVISEDAARDVRSLVPGSEPTVVHMGVEVPEHVVSLPERSTCRLVCVASLVPVKDHASLLTAFAELRDLDATLDLVGGGPLETELRTRVHDLGLDERVRFLGTLGHRQLLERLRGGDWDAIVLTSGASGSEHEGIPVSLMEAMAAGIPALATASGATGELVGDGAGILVPAGDPAALAEELRRVVTDAGLRSQLGAAARSRVEASFDVVKIAARLRDLFATEPAA
jgi:colanic acid/amylovoran biosynthesis glycosyltransferase